MILQKTDRWYIRPVHIPLWFGSLLVEFETLRGFDGSFEF
jgi:hypothetical protein